jgi:hypothetical protein
MEGAGTRVINGKGSQDKFFWQGCQEGSSGVGILVSEEFVDKVVEVRRLSERLIMVKLVIGKCLVNVISGYAPQVGRSEMEKDKFWTDVSDLVEGLGNDETVVLGGDLNGHVGSKSDGYEGVHGGYGVGTRNAEGTRILEFAVEQEMILCGTQFKKEETKLVTYSSGGSATTVDYLMVRGRDRKHLRDAKAIPGEEAVTQHCLIVVDMHVKGALKVKQETCVPRRKIWRLRESGVQRIFEEKLAKSGIEHTVGSSANEIWEKTRDGLLKAASEACGWTKGKPRHRQTWWWNEEVEGKINEKKVKYKAWCKAQGTDMEDEALAEYVKAKRNAKKSVALAKNKESRTFGERLDSEEGQRSVFRVARQMAKERRDVIGVNCLRNENGGLIVQPEDVKNRWKMYMERLLNVENDWDKVVECDVVEGPEERITEEEVENAIRKLKCRKAGGPTELVGDVLRAAGKTGVSLMTEICNLIVKEGKIPADWELSTLTPVYKGKGDPLECGSYRAIKLLEHAMKVFERVIERRLRRKIEINGMQFGFMPGRSTTDAIFIVRQLQEKFMAKKRALYYAFVDLEKAFDRVPREVVRWALRKLMVEEWLVNVVMAMYEKARTMVRVSQGYSDQFEVSVGVHQGSVLSPLLFVSVMEVLVREVREGLPWEVLYADDLVLVAESMESLKQKVIAWRNCMEAKGLKMNVGKTKVMVSGENCGSNECSGKWPCAVCAKGVGSNSIRCTSCEGWVHRKCTGVKGPLRSVEGTFVCKTCRKQGGAERQEEGLDLGNGDCLEIVSKFCYLGDMLNGNGGVDSALVTRVRCAWNKFRELQGILTKKDVSWKLKGKVYSVCVRSAMIYGSETWAMTSDQMKRLERAEMKMVRWMCGVTLAHRMKCADLRERLGIEPVSSVVGRSRLRWLGHVLRKNDDDWVKKVMSFEVEGSRGRGRPKIEWMNVVKMDMAQCGLKLEDAGDRVKWRRLSWKATGQPPCKRGTRP